MLLYLFLISCCRVEGQQYSALHQRMNPSTAVRLQLNAAAFWGLMLIILGKNVTLLFPFASRTSCDKPSAEVYISARKDEQIPDGCLQTIGKEDPAQLSKPSLYETVIFYHKPPSKTYIYSVQSRTYYC